MRESHKNVFFEAAQGSTCWIGLREPNEFADRWIGLTGHTPKMEACKAKTADNPAYRFAGLVVDPILCRDAFRLDTLHEAIDKWQTKFLIGGLLPMYFTRIESGPEVGLVQYHRDFIHSDFDLMALCRSNANGEFLATSDEEQKQLYAAVAPLLNRGLEAQMIQHGAEFMWDEGVGARESEYVLWFGPGRRYNQWLSSMPRGGH